MRRIRTSIAPVLLAGCTSLLAATALLTIRPSPSVTCCFWCPFGSTVVFSNKIVPV